MKYLTLGIVFTEIPNEITLEIGISNCPYRCKGCHSPFLQADLGEEISWEWLKSAINDQKNLITCVLFSGGDVLSVTYLCKLIRINFPDIKTAWYSGGEEFPEHLEYFDFIKLGPYIEDLGGLKSPTTNQRLYQVISGKEVVNITYEFWK
jgi:anaerobic ribonucleoside-triphosphate reductase activating protein